MSRHRENPYRDVSPGVLFRAVAGIRASGGSDYAPDLTGDYALDVSVYNASDEEKAFGLKIADSAQSLKAWCEELEGWSQTLTDPPSLVSTQGSSAGSTQEKGSHAWLHLSDKLISQYDSRIKQITSKLGELDIEKQKAVVLDTHQTYQRLSGNATELKKAYQQQTQLSGLSALTTAVILNSLPHHGRLVSLIDLWSIRLFVLERVPDFLTKRQSMADELLAAWKNLESPVVQEGKQCQSESLDRRKADSDESHRVLTEKLVVLGKQLDVMLDALEGRQDTLPDQWIADVDSLEEGFSSWTVTNDAQLRGQAEALSEAEEQKTQEHVVTEQEEFPVVPDFISTKPVDDTLKASQTLSDGPGPANNLPEIFVDHIVNGGSKAKNRAKRPDDIKNKKSDRPSLITPDYANFRASLILDDDTQPFIPSNEVGSALNNNNSNNSTGRKSMERGFSDSDILQKPISGDPPARTSSVKKTLFVHGSGRGKGLHRRHSSLELSTAGVESASFASGFSMSEVKRIDIVRTDSDTPERSGRRASDSKVTQPTSSQGAEHWTVSRWKANKEASELPSPPSAGNSDPMITAYNLPPLTNVIEESSAAGTGGTSSDEEPGLSSSPGLAPTIEAAVAEQNMPTQSIGELTADLDTRPATSVLDFNRPKKEDRNLATPKKSSRLETPEASTDDQIERKIDRILHTIPTRIKFDTKGSNRTPSRLSTNANPSDISPRDSSRTLSSTTRPVTPALTLSRAEQPYPLTAKSKSNVSTIRLYHLLQIGRSAPIKLYVRLVGDEGRVMVRVGGGWEDLEKYLREYAAHHHRAVVPELQDIGNVSTDARRAFTAPGMIDDRPNFSGSTTLGPLIPDRAPSRLAKAPPVISGGLQIPKRQSSAVAAARSISAQHPRPTTSAESSLKPTNNTVFTSTLPNHSVASDTTTSIHNPSDSTPALTSTASHQEETIPSDDNSSHPTSARLSAERKAWLDNVVARAKQWKAEGGSSGPATPDAGVQAVSASPIGSNAGGTRRVFRDDNGTLRDF